MPQKKTDADETTTVRISSDLRYRAKEQASRERRSLRELVEDAIQAYLKRKGG